MNGRTAAAGHYFDAEDLEKSWLGCRIGASAFVEKASGGRPGGP